LASVKLLWTTLGGLVEVVEVISIFDAVVAKADCLFQPEVWIFCPGIPSDECHILSVGLELLNIVAIQQEAGLDTFSKSSIESP